MPYKIIAYYTLILRRFTQRRHPSPNFPEREFSAYYPPITSYQGFKI